jgi:DinB superfamily
MNTDPKREMLRHTVATLAYRGGKAVRGATDSFASFRPSETSRTPAQILAHIGDLLDWALSMAKGAEKWHNSEPQSWTDDVERFHTSLTRLDEYLGSGEELGATCERLFQGAIADSLTHVGQLTMLRRIAGDPIRGENYSKADIKSGRVGVEQTKPQFEFD